MSTDTKDGKVATTKKIDVVSLIGVHGRIQHPYTLVWFDREKGVDHVIDEWVKTQMDGGKITLA